MTSPLPVRPAASAESMRVCDIVRQGIDPALDPWDLALVQRDRVWDWERTAWLLDSLLVGYPIGSLLLCRLRATEEPASLVPAMDRDHRVRMVSSESFQLLDGQQRVGALLALFSKTDEGSHYLDLILERPVEEQLAIRRRRRISAMAYIQYRRAGYVENNWKPIENRGQNLDLSRFAAWADATDVGPSTALVALAGMTISGEVDTGVLLAAALTRARSAGPEDIRGLRRNLGFLSQIDPRLDGREEDVVSGDVDACEVQAFERLQDVVFAVELYLLNRDRREPNRQQTRCSFCD